MLNEKERNGCLKFLQDFQSHELLSLVETVTNRMVTVQRKKDAIAAIVQHSESALGLLRRRKVKKEYIFRHLAAEHVSASPTADKETLVRQLLSHWGTNVSELHDLHVQKDEDWMNNGDQRGSLSESSQVDSSSLQPPIHIQTLAVQFTSWFFQQLNSLSQDMSGPVSRDWGPHHFWEDSKLALRISSSDCREETLQGAELVAQRFRSFVLEEGLIFNPNISPDGTVGWNESHGLVGVGVCGTVHRGNECLGLFEQQFGLIRDPLRENIWKIKFVNMNMKQAAVHQMPTLTAPTQHLTVT